MSTMIFAVPAAVFPACFVMAVVAASMLER